jgi:hypothetical protein
LSSGKGVIADEGVEAALFIKVLLRRPAAAAPSRPGPVLKGYGKAIRAVLSWHRPLAITLARRRWPLTNSIACAQSGPGKNRGKNPSTSSLPGATVKAALFRSTRPRYLRRILLYFPERRHENLLPHFHHHRCYAVVAEVARTHGAPLFCTLFLEIFGVTQFASVQCWNSSEQEIQLLDRGSVSFPFCCCFHIAREPSSC